jgi:hypothetical protein
MAILVYNYILLYDIIGWQESRTKTVRRQGSLRMPICICCWLVVCHNVLAVSHMQLWFLLNWYSAAQDSDHRLAGCVLWSSPRLQCTHWPTVAEWSRRTYPAPLGAGGVGSIPANSAAQNVPSFRRWRFEMKLSPFCIGLLCSTGPGLMINWPWSDGTVAVSLAATGLSRPRPIESEFTGNS